MIRHQQERLLKYAFTQPRGQKLRGVGNFTIGPSVEEVFVKDIIFLHIDFFISSV